MALLGVGLVGALVFVGAYIWASAEERHLKNRLDEIERKREDLRAHFEKQTQLFNQDDCALTVPR
jgi:hypothetical protein